MGSYRVNKPNFNDNIYTFDNEDLVQGGLQGIDNRPLKELADNMAHIKKYKSQIITGTDNPNSINLYSVLKNDYQIQEDIEVEQDDDLNWYIVNLLYYKYDDGTFWKCILTNSPQSGESQPDLQDGSISWYNLTSQTILDTTEVRISRNPGNTGASDDYFKLVQTESGGDEYLTVEKYTNNVIDSDLGNMKINELNVNKIDAESSNVSNVANKEVLINSSISTPAENDDGAFTVKRLADVGMTISSITLDQSAPSGYSDLLGFDLIVAVPPVGLTSDFISDGDFIQIDGTVNNDGFYKVATVDNDNIYVYKTYFSATSSQGAVGNIYLNDSAQIKWNETDDIWELKTAGGQYLGLRVNSVSLTGGGTGSSDFQYGILYNRIIESQAEFDDFFSNINDITENEHVLIKENTSGASVNYDLGLNITVNTNLVKLSMQNGVFINLTSGFAGFEFDTVEDIEWDLFLTSNIYINDMITLSNCERCSFNLKIKDSVGTNVITADNTSSLIEVKIDYQNGEYVSIFNACEDFIITNAFIDTTNTGSDKIFNTCLNIAVDGIINNDTFLGAGDFNW